MNYTGSFQKEVETAFIQVGEEIWHSLHIATRKWNSGQCTVPKQCVCQYSCMTHSEDEGSKKEHQEFEPKPYKKHEVKGICMVHHVML